MRLLGGYLRRPNASAIISAMYVLIYMPAFNEEKRIAEVVARTARELLAPPSERSAWFVRMLAEDTTCLLGGNVAERTADGQAAYGIELPGQVLRLGLEDICGVAESVPWQGEPLQSWVPSWKRTVLLWFPPGNSPWQ